MTTRALSSPPRVLPLYARALAPLLPGASRLPFVGGGGGELPDLELTLAQARADPDRLAAYAHVCGFSLRNELPATYPHVLAFPLQLALMADRRFPFGAVGLVHVANRIVQHRPIQLSETLELSVKTTPLRAHPRGRTFALVSEARIGEELVWEDTSTMLRRGGGADGAQTGSAGRIAEPGNGDGATADRIAEPGDDDGATADRIAEPEPPPRSAVWRLPGDLGRRYAAVSGDSNPIHLHALSAKLFGFPRAIAHGMWTKARCLAALEQRLPPGFSVDVSFRRPILLPAQVGFGSVEEGTRIRFTAQDAERGTRHLSGHIEPLTGPPPTQSRRDRQTL